MKLFFLRVCAFSALLIIVISCGKEELEPITVSADEFVVDILENPQSGEIIGAITADTNRGNLGFEMLMQEPAGAILVDEDSGVISIGDVSVFDFEERLFTTAMIRVYNEDKEVVIVARINILDGEG